MPEYVPTQATVPVKSSFLSKINWVQVGGLVLGAFTGLSGALPPDQAAVATVAIQGVQSLATIVFRTWFSKAVTPQSLG